MGVPSCGTTQLCVNSRSRNCAGYYSIPPGTKFSGNSRYLLPLPEMMNKWLLQVDRDMILFEPFVGLNDRVQHVSAGLITQHAATCKLAG